MLKEDVELLMGHCRCSLSAGGDLLGAMIRIKKFIEEAQKTPCGDWPNCGGRGLQCCNARDCKCFDAWA